MLNYSILPENLREGMQVYIERGIPPGDFLQACLANDLSEAIGRASTRTWDYLHSTMMFCYNELPSRSYSESPWGSREAIKNHIERRHLARKGESHGRGTDEG